MSLSHNTNLQMAKQHRPDTSLRRRGFTLLELLGVVAIIAILMSLTFVVMAGVVQQAEEEATKVTVLKVNRLLEQRIEAFDRAFKGSRRDDYVKGTVDLLTQIDGRFDYFRQNPDQAPPAILLLARKAGFRFEFPQRMEELILFPGDDTNSNGLPDSVERRVALPNARSYLLNHNLGLPTPSSGFNPSASDIQAVADARWGGGSVTVDFGAPNGNITFQFLGNAPETVSSALLHYSLFVSGTFGSSSVDADAFGAAEIVDTDDDGLPEFVDAWGNPLRFYRWPTRLIDPTAPTPFAPLFDDPNDPTEVEPDPLIHGESRGMRAILPIERELAALTFKGLPPEQLPINGVTQRDLMLVDPDDPVGILYTFIEDPKYLDMGIDLTREFNELKYHTPDTYHAPLIISAGSDGRLGLYEPGQVLADHDNNPSTPAVPVFGNLAQYVGTAANISDGPLLPSPAIIDLLSDNISNRNRRAGGRR